MQSFITKILVFVFFSLCATTSFADIFINEINYKAPASEKGLELAGDAGTNLSGWKLAFYGADGVQTGTQNLAGIVPDLQNSKGAIWIEIDQAMPPATGGGVVVIRPSQQVQQFLSFGGLVTPLVAQGGAAAGKTAEYIGSQLDADNSLQLTGSGLTYVDFVWGIPQGSTPFEVNTNQSFLPNVAMSMGQTSDGIQTIDDQSIKVAVQPLSVVAYPNPVVNELRITFPEMTTSMGRLYIYDAFGKLVDAQPVAVGATQATVDFQQQLRGHYVVYLETGTERVSQVVMKQ